MKWYEAAESREEGCGYSGQIVLFLMLFLIAFLFSVPAFSQNVQFAGLVFVGSEEDTEKTMPVTKRLLNERGLESVNRELIGLLNSVQRPDIQFVFGGGSVNSGRAFATALAINSETFSSDRTSRGGKLSVDLKAQILTFDFSSKRIISAFPLDVMYYEVFEDGADLDELKRLILAKALFLDAGAPTGASLFELFTKRLETFEFKEGWNANLQVKKVVLAENARKAVAARGYPEDAYENWVATSFASALSQVHGIPVLPFTRGQALNEMRLRFDEGNEIGFTFPPADFGVELTVTGFGTKVVKETEARVFKSHGVGLAVKFFDPNFNEVYLDENLLMSRVEQYSKGSKREEWPIYEDLERVLMNEINEQIDKPDKKWIDEHVRGDKKAKVVTKQLIEVQKRIISEIKG